MMLSHLWARIDPFQWRETIQYSLSNISFCAICGTCGCPPVSDGSLNGHNSNTFAFDKDNVAWLGSLQIIGGRPALGQNALKHPVESVFTTGILKYEQGRICFYGSDSDFNDIHMDVVEDLDGTYLSVDEKVFQRLIRPTAADNASLHLRVHSKCHEILRRVLVNKQGLALGKSRNFRIEPLLFDRLSAHSLFRQKIMCTSKEGIPPSLGADPVLVGGNMRVGLISISKYHTLITSHRMSS